MPVNLAVHYGIQHGTVWQHLFARDWAKSLGTAKRRSDETILSGSQICATQLEAFHATEQVH